MMTILIPLFVALIGGVAGALQAPFAGMIGRALGDLQSVLITYCVGAVVIVLITLLIQGGMHMEAWRSVPWYVFLSGPLGLIIVGSFSFTVPRLGVATATMVFVAASLVLGAVFDHVGIFGVPQRTLDASRLLGITIFVIGIWLVR